MWKLVQGPKWPSAKKLEQKSREKGDYFWQFMNNFLWNLCFLQFVHESVVAFSWLMNGLSRKWRQSGRRPQRKHGIHQWRLVVVEILVLSCLIMSYHGLSCLIMSYHVLSCLIMSCHGRVAWKRTDESWRLVRTTMYYCKWSKHDPDIVDRTHRWSMVKQITRKYQERRLPTCLPDLTWTSSELVQDLSEFR